MKSKNIQNVLDSLTVKFGKMSRTDALKQCKCVSCGGDASKFKDDISKKEYGISGLCQNCQDEVFND